MFRVSHRCQYGLRAVYELGRLRGQGPIPISRLTGLQAIPRRFLGVILRELRQAGVVAAKRGVKGGYTLAADPKEVTVGRVIRVFDGTMEPVRCVACGGDLACELAGNCVFEDLWKRAGETIAGMFDSVTLQDILDGKVFGGPGSVAAAATEGGGQTDATSANAAEPTD